jgi:hypothetical protein
MEERMICRGCAAGADMAEDYRVAAREDDERREAAGEPKFEAGPARRWLKKRVRWAMTLHCQKRFTVVAGVRDGGPGCTCQCLIPELQS